MISIKRVYDTANETDGYRILVDRIWPRGITKEKAQIDAWLKEIAPSKALRQAFHQEGISFEKFESAYLLELQQKETKQAFGQLKGLVKTHQVVTLVIASKDEQHNQAVILKQLLEDE